MHRQRYHFAISRAVAAGSHRDYIATMLATVIVCIVIICLAQGYPGGWLGGFAEMGSMMALAAVPGLPWLLGSALDDWLGTGFLAPALGWLGTGVLVLLALGAVVQGIARLIDWWRDEPQLLPDHDDRR